MDELNHRNRPSDSAPPHAELRRQIEEIDKATRVETLGHRTEAALRSWRSGIEHLIEAGDHQEAGVQMRQYLNFARRIVLLNEELQTLADGAHLAKLRLVKKSQADLGRLKHEISER